MRSDDRETEARGGLDFAASFLHLSEILGWVRQFKCMDSLLV